MDTRQIAAIRRMISGGLDDKTIALALDAFSGSADTSTPQSTHVARAATGKTTIKRRVKNGATVYNAIINAKAFDAMTLTDTQRIVGAWIMANPGKTTAEIASAVKHVVGLGWDKRPDNGAKPLQSILYQLRHTTPVVIQSTELEPAS